MKLWLIEQKDPWYDENEGFVVRAESEQEARELVSAFAADEGKETWLDSGKSTCVQVQEDGEKGVVLRAFKGS